MNEASEDTRPWPLRTGAELPGRPPASLEFPNHPGPGSRGLPVRADRAAGEPVSVHRSLSADGLDQQIGAFIGYLRISFQGAQVSTCALVASWVWYGFAISLPEPYGTRTIRIALRRDLFTELDPPSLAAFLQTLRFAEMLREFPTGRILLLRPDASPQVWLADLRLPFA